MMVEHSQDDEIRIALEVPIAALVQVANAFSFLERTRNAFQRAAPHGAAVPKMPLLRLPSGRRLRGLPPCHHEYP